MQREHSSANEAAWNQGPYEAWVHRYGTPAEAAAKIRHNPAGRLASLLPHLGDVHGAKAMNLLGSHGGKAVALGMLGASVTVVDIASENARYAQQLAEAAGIPLRYIVDDVLELPDSELTGDYDLVLMEFGILHYFLDLAPLMRVTQRLLRTGGRLVLQDFHPVSTKLISSKGTTAAIRKHKVTGDYFDESVEETEVPYAKFLADGEPTALKKVRQRKWNLGEIVTAVADAGLIVKKLVEEPNRSSDIFDRGIPKSFTIVAKKG